MTTVTPLLPFITPDELRAALGEDLPEDQALWLVDLGSAAVRAEVNQIVNLVEDDEVILDGSGSGTILLPEIAVHHVGEVSLLEVVLLPDEYDWDAAGCLYRTLITWRNVSGRWPRIPRAVRVVYTHGWGMNTPQWGAARQVALEVASRTFRNPLMLQSERIGDWSRAWVPRGGRAELTDAERSSLDILRPGR